MKNIFSCFIFTRNAVCVYKQSQVSFGIQSFCGKREINLVRNFIFLLFFYSSSDTRKNVSPYSLEESLSISKNRLFLHYFDFWYVGLYHCRMLGQVRFSLHHVPCCFCRSKSDSAPSSCIHAAPWIPEMLCSSFWWRWCSRRLHVTRATYLQSIASRKLFGWLDLIRPNNLIRPKILPLRHAHIDSSPHHTCVSLVTHARNQFACCGCLLTLIVF